MRNLFIRLQATHWCYNYICHLGKVRSMTGLLNRTEQDKIYSKSIQNDVYYIKQRIYWFEKNVLFEKIWVFDFSKLALVCMMKISGLWHALHAIAETEWYHNCVVIATEGAIHWWPGNFIGGQCLVQIWSCSCYGNRLVLWFHFCNGMQCMPCSWDFHAAYQCQF